MGIHKRKKKSTMDLLEDLDNLSKSRIKKKNNKNMKRKATNLKKRTTSHKR